MFGKQPFVAKKANGFDPLTAVVTLCANWHTFNAIQAANPCEKCCVHVNSCLVEPQCYDPTIKKALGQTLVDKQVNNDNLLGMTTPDKHETEAAQEICVTAIQAVKQYTFDPGDFEAATVAVLARAIELTARKEMTLCFKPSSSTLNN